MPDEKYDVKIGDKFIHAELACLVSAIDVYIVAISSSSSSPAMGFDFGPCPWHLGFIVGAPAVIISESLPISLRPVGPVCNLTALGRLSGDDEYVGDIEVEEDIGEEVEVDVNNVVQVCAVVSSATTSSAQEPGTRGARTAPKSEVGLWVMALNSSADIKAAFGSDFLALSRSNGELGLSIPGGATSWALPSLHGSLSLQTSFFISGKYFGDVL